MFSYQCSFLLLPFHATAFILYQSVSCLSTTFFISFFCRCEAVLHTTALIEYHIHPSLSTAFLFDFAIHFFFAVLSEFSKLICSEILQFFKIFARMTSACHSLVSVSISERMLSYHGFSELSMLFLYFAQFRIFRHFGASAQCSGSAIRLSKMISCSHENLLV